ncbi:MAG TPA: hypothetical protein VGB08_09765 [Allosphingosinicella sp.]
MPREGEQRRRRRGAERTQGQQIERHKRRLLATLAREQPGRTCDGGAGGAERCGWSFADQLRGGEEAGRSGGVDRGAEQVDRAARRFHRRQGRGGGQSERGQRRCHREERAPAREGQEESAGRRRHGGADGDHQGIGGNGGRQPAGSERVPQQRYSERHDRRAAEPLHEARGDEQGQRRRKGAKQCRDAEQRDADPEQSPVADPLGQVGAG